MEMSLEQLKAKAYDSLALIEFYQNQLRETNNLIAEKLKEQEEKPKK